MITKDELAAMIAALESQPHLSIKEEKYLAVCHKLQRYEEAEPFAFYGCYADRNDSAYYNTASAAHKDGCDYIIPLYEHD